MFSRDKEVQYAVCLEIGTIFFSSSSFSCFFVSLLLGRTQCEELMFFFFLFALFICLSKQLKGLRRKLLHMN